MRSPTVKSYQMEFGNVDLTAKQLQYILDRVQGKNGGMKGSTQYLMVKKIKNATHWDMKPVQLFCRFAYAMGICKL